MTEIELKAHVADPDKTAGIIAGFARSAGECIKRDTYWKSESADAHSAGNTSAVGEAPSGDPAVRIAAAGIVFTLIAALAAAAFTIIGLPRIVTIVVLLGASAIASLWAAVSASFPGLHRARHNSLKVRIREEISVDSPSVSSTGIPAGERAHTVVTYKRKEIRGEIEVNDEREFGIDNRGDFEALLRDLGFTEAIRKEKRTRTFEYRADDGTAVTIELSLVGPLGWFLEVEILADSPSPEETLRAQTILRETLARCGIPESAIETRYYTDMLAAAPDESAREDGNVR